MSLLHKLILFATLPCGFANTAFPSEKPPLFHPSFSFIGSYTFTKDFSYLNDGLFRIDHKRGNFGFELTNKFYAAEDYFLKTGVRYHQYRKTITGLNQIPEIYDYPSPFIWELRYAALNIPILLGKDFTTKTGKKGDFYFGLAPGILMNTYKKSSINLAKSRDAQSTDPVYGVLLDNETGLPDYFFVTADVGITFAPVKTIPRFTVGALCSFQLNRAQGSQHSGVVAMPSQGYDFLYELYNEGRISNLSVVFSYNLGRRS